MAATQHAKIRMNKTTTPRNDNQSVALADVNNSLITLSFG